MNILMSVRKHWIDMIKDGSKKLEFRNRIGKEFKIGNTIYFYESGKDGKKKITCSAKIKSITKIEHQKCDTVLFVDYYLKNVIKNEFYLKEWEKTKEIDLPGYSSFIKLSNMFCSDYIKLLSEGKRDEYEYDTENLKKKDLSNKISDDIDNWLYNIGYWNSLGETNYNYAIELCDVEEVDLNLSDFTCNGKVISRPPQSYLYCEKIK